MEKIIDIYVTSISEKVRVHFDNGQHKEFTKTKLLEMLNAARGRFFPELFGNPICMKCEAALMAHRAESMKNAAQKSPTR